MVLVASMHMQDVIYMHNRTHTGGPVYSTLTLDGGETNVAYNKHNMSATTYRESEERMADGKGLTVTNLRISSITTTGALKYNTAFHSVQLRGVMANKD